MTILPAFLPLFPNTRVSRFKTHHFQEWEGREMAEWEKSSFQLPPPPLLSLGITQGRKKMVPMWEKIRIKAGWFTSHI